MSFVPTELTEAQVAELRDSKLFNEDLAPVPAGRRKWRAGSFAALWRSNSTAVIVSLDVSQGLSHGETAWDSFWDKLNLWPCVT